MRYWSGQEWTADRVLPVGARETGPGYGRLANATVALLVFSGLVAVAGLAQELWALGQVTGWQADPGRLTTAAAHRFDTLEAAFDLGETVLMVVTGIVFLIWQAKTYVSAAVDRDELRRGRALSLWSWFIPVVTLWWPLQNIRDLWWGVQPVKARLAVRHRRPMTLVMLAWWLAWIATLALERAASVVAAADSSLKTLNRAVSIATLAEATTVIAAAACAWIVRRIAARVRLGGYRAD